MSVCREEIAGRSFGEFHGGSGKATARDLLEARWNPRWSALGPSDKKVNTLEFWQAATASHGHLSAIRKIRIQT